MLRYLFFFPLIFPVLFFNNCKEKDEELFIPPVLEMYPAEVHEGPEEENLAEIKINLNKASPEPVRIIWSTEGITAMPNEDFENMSEMESIIEPGKTESILQVTIIDDGQLEFSEIFKVRIDYIENAEIMNSESMITIIDNSRYIPALGEEGYITPLEYPDMDLVWHDEFSGNSINEIYWNYDHPNGFPLNCGWAADETGKYTGDKEHLFIGGGFLTIKATVDPVTGIYRTSRLNTNQKMKISYGRIDIRAKIPEESGLSTNFWLMGDDMDEIGWPKCGEIDIMKHSGKTAGKLLGGLLYDKGSVINEIRKWSPSLNEDLTGKFHIYSIFWEEDRIRWYVDYQPFFEINKNDFSDFKLISKHYFLIINLAIGGEFAGDPANDLSFPHNLVIDYIRIYQRESNKIEG